ncbi:MAG: hypothetical protein ACI8PG_004819, partial [Planctomycetota bacterium]
SLGTIGQRRNRITQGHTARHEWEPSRRRRRIVLAPDLDYADTAKKATEKWPTFPSTKEFQTLVVKDLYYGHFLNAL